MNFTINNAQKKPAELSQVKEDTFNFKGMIWSH